MNQSEYSGRDNLTVMQGAKNYNNFLFGLVHSQISQGNKVIDFGAGSGTFAILLTKAGYKITCVETDSSLSKTLNDLGFDVVKDLMSIEDGCVDYIYTLNVLEHIQDDGAVCKLWFRKLKPGGRLFIYVPALRILYTSMDSKVGHFRRYSMSSLRQKLVDSGFKVSKIRYADSLGVLATLLYKALDNGRGDINPSMLRVYDKFLFPISRLLDSVLCRFFGKNVYAFARK